MDTPKLGIIGGSGMCSFPEIEIVSKVRPETKYGNPSDEIIIGQLAGRSVAFLPRHGSSHRLPPHKIPYRANIEALKSVGVEYIIATCITGSLQKSILPGSIVIPDQFVDLTWGRDDTYDADQRFIHLPMGEPYCAEMRKLARASALLIDPQIQSGGTVAVIQGPRFSTAAETKWLSTSGWDIVNMTQYPECYFAKDLGLCYAAIATVTDYAVGLDEEFIIDPLKMEDVLKVFRQNISKTRSILMALAETQYGHLQCQCAKRVTAAYYEQSP